MLQFRIELHYGCEEKLKKMSEEQILDIRKNVLALSDMKDPHSDEYFYPPRDFIADEKEVKYLKDLGFELTIKNFKNTYENKLSNEKNAPSFHLHLPNLGLLGIKYVTYLEDACTDKVQYHLDKGWKILAVCPPNGARRPDYIFGSDVEII